MRSAAPILPAPSRNASAIGYALAGVPLPGLAFPRPRPHKRRRFLPADATRRVGGPKGGLVVGMSPEVRAGRTQRVREIGSRRGIEWPPRHVSVSLFRLVEVPAIGVPRVGSDVMRRTSVRPARRRRAKRIQWAGISQVVALALCLGSGLGVAARQYMDQRAVAAPLPGISSVQAQPLVDPTLADAQPTPSPVALPDHILLQVPFTTQAPLNNWAQHQESCEAANLTMLVGYWQHDPSVVIDPHAADSTIHQIDGWKPQPDLNDTMLGDLAQQHFGYSYRIVPNDPQVIAEQLAAGRPLIAEVRTHGLGNPHYPGYSNHFEQQGWSVPHFVLIIGYDSTGVFLNDPGISWGRGYHISYSQLSHAIDDLNQHHPALSQGQVLLLIAPGLNAKPQKAV